MGKQNKKRILLLTALVMACAVSAFALLKTGVFGNEKNFLATDGSVRYDIVADLDGGSFELGTKPEFIKMDNGKWLHKYKPSMLPTKLPTPVKTGYEFVGWEVEGVEGVQPNYSIPSWNKENLNIKAHWKLIEANLKPGQEFNADLLALPDFNNVRQVVFDKKWEEGRGIDVTVDQNGAALAWIEGDVLHISSMTDKIYANPNAYGMFEDFVDVLNFDLGHLDTSKSTNLHRLFSDCQSVTSLDVSTLDTSNATDLGSMFKDCHALQTVNLEGFDSSKAKDLGSLFKECHALKTVDGTKIDTSSAVDMNGMFWNCARLESIDTSTWKTSKAENMGHIFYQCASLKTVDVSGWDVSNVWNFSTAFYDCGNLETLDVSNWKTSSAEDLGNIFGECKKLKVLDVANWDMSNVLDLGGAFTSCESLIQLDTSKWKTHNVTDLHSTFSGCKSLPVLDVSGWDTSKVTTLNRTFLNCEMIGELNTSNWNTSACTDMERAFRSCKSCETIDVSGWDTSKVTSLDRTFMECYKVKELDVSKWKTPNVTDLTRTFWDCRVVPKLDCSGWDTSKVVNMDRTFCDVNTATEINVSGWNTTACTDFHRMFADCHAVPRLDISSFDTSKGTDLAYMFTGMHSIEYLDCIGIDTGKSTRLTGMFLYCFELKTLDNLDLDFSSTSGTQSMFGDCHNLSGEITINALVPEQMPEGTDPSDEEYWGIDYMFDHASNLSGKFIVKYVSPETKELARRMVATKAHASQVFLWEEPATLVSGSDFRSKVKAMPEFANVTEIKFVKARANPDGIDLSEKQDGSIRGSIEGNVLTVACEGEMYANSDCHSMFWGMQALVDISFNNFNTSQVTDMSKMFNGCQSLRVLDVSNWDTSSVTNMWSMFSVCRSLKVLDVSKWDTACVRNMNQMFQECSGLTTLNASNFNTSEVTDMHSMFMNCYNLTTLDVSKWNTSNVTDTGYMFTFCRSLTSLDVGKWDVSKINNMTCMFMECSNLTTLDVSKWDTSQVTEIDSMFRDCLKLSGEITISNPNITAYSYMFNECSSDPDAEFWVKYTSPETKEVARKMVETKNPEDHVYLYETADLLSGPELNTILKQKVPTSSAGAISIIFKKVTSSEMSTGVDVSANKDGSIKLDVEGWIGSSPNRLAEGADYVIKSDKIIKFNPNSSTMFKDVSGQGFNISFSNIDTSSVTNMSEMFNNPYISNISGLQNFDTSQVTSMSFMFNGCEELTSLDVSSFDTSQVISMNNMFWGCRSLKALDVKNFDTSHTEGMRSLFGRCTSLEKIDISHFDLKSLKNMSSMFSSCAALTEIKGLDSLDITKVGNIYGMLYGCSKLSGELTVIGHASYGYNEFFKNCSTDPSAKFIVKYADDVAAKTFAENLVNTKTSNSNVFLYEKPETLVDGKTFRDTIRSLPGYNRKTEIRFIKGTPKDSGVPVSANGTAKAYLEGDAIIVASEKDIYANPDCTLMFDLHEKGVSSLTKVVLDNFNTSEVTDMSNMFSGDSGETWGGFTEIVGLEKFDTRKVNDMHMMFAYCNNLDSLDLTNFDTRSAIDMGDMFLNCHKLSGELTIANPGVTAFRRMFSGCSTDPNARFTVKYVDSATKAIAESMVATKSDNSNVSLVAAKEKTSFFSKIFNSLFNTQQSNPDSQQNTDVPQPTINITLNNGSMAMYPKQTIQIPAGEIGDLAKPDLNPKYAGQFGGYYYDKNCTIPVQNSDIITQDIELYAKW